MLNTEWLLDINSMSILYHNMLCITILNSFILAILRPSFAIHPPLIEDGGLLAYCLLNNKVCAYNKIWLELKDIVEIAYLRLITA